MDHPHPQPQQPQQKQQPPQQQQQQQPHEPVHCFWALMTYGDLRFIYLSSSVQRAVSAKYKQLLGQSFFDYIHPDEAKLARKDLNAFMDVHNLYGSVTRCRFRNVCPEWQQRKLARQPGTVPQPSISAAALQAAATEGGLSSRGLGRNGLRTNDTGSREHTAEAANRFNNSNDNSNNDKLSALSAAAAAMSNGQHSDQESAVGDGDEEDEGCKDYEDIFQNGEEDEFMILDVVMNVVSDEVVLGFFHIDGQGLYKGFWSNGSCGESKESLANLAPEIMRHLRDSVSVKNGSSKDSSTSSPESSPRRQNSDHMTKRIFQLYDSHNRNLLLTWPEPGNRPNDTGTMAYNPELYTQIVKSHHIPADALENTTCLKRFCSKHALPNLNPSSQEPSYQVESVFIPYGHIIFACFQTSPAAPTNSWSMLASPTTSSAATPGSHLASSSPGSRSFGPSYEAGGGLNDHLSGLGLLSSPSQAGSALFGIGSAHGSPSSAQNSPLVIPALPSVSPFLKHAVAGQMPMASGQAPSPSLTGPIRNKSAGNQSSGYYPYSRNSALSNTSSAASSPSNLPLPEAMQESLSFLNDYKPAEPDRKRGGGSMDEGHPLGMGDCSSHSMWHASTPHPAIAAMVGHALAPSSPSFQRTVTGADGRSSHTRQKSSSTLSTPADSGIKDKDGKPRKLPSSPRHPAHDAAIRKKSSSSASSSSPPASYQDADSSASDQGLRSNQASSGGHGGHVLRVQQEEKACESCGTTNSPEWRRGQSGKKDLCNACGLRYSRSVARQNRQAQKQLEGKTGKAKTPKTSKDKKANSKKGGALEVSAAESMDDDHRDQTNGSFIQNTSQQHHHQQQQLQQQAHQTHLGHPYPSASSYGNPVPPYPMAVQPSFYHGQ